MHVRYNIISYSKQNEISNFNDSDETLCLAAQKSHLFKQVNTTENECVDDILKEPDDNGQNNRKKQKLEDSYDWYI